MSQGTRILCRLELEDAGPRLPRHGNPQGRSLLKGSGISQPQLTGFISYLHFPLVLYIHVWIFSEMKCGSGDCL